jgi:hypothetical protein
MNIKGQPINKRFRYQDVDAYGDSASDDYEFIHNGTKGGMTKTIIGPLTFRPSKPKKEKKIVFVDTEPEQPAPEVIPEPVQPKPVIKIEPMNYWKAKKNHGVGGDNLLVCPVCQTEHRPGPYSQHMKKHLRAGEVVKREIVRSECGNKTKGYAWNNPFEYVRIVAASD